jgi:hypothetical protein
MDFPWGTPEIVFKFRHPDEQQATAMEVKAERSRLATESAW